MARSASDDDASDSSWSAAPGSSGFGNSTVGNSGSGAACDSTSVTSVKPARRKASTAVSPPTPCIGVSTTRRSRAVPRGNDATCVRYDSTCAAVTGSAPDATGTMRAAGTPRMAASMSLSSGGTICEPAGSPTPV
jgi:hypothetical protein